jgi:hypothetical protein
MSISEYQLFDHSKTKKSKSNRERVGEIYSSVQKCGMAYKNKSKPELAIKLSFSALKFILPEGAAVAQAGLDLRKYLLNEKNPEYREQQKLLYIAFILLAKLNRAALPKYFKELSNVGIAMANCRKDTLNDSDMRLRNNKVIRNSLGFFGGTFGGIAGASLMPQNPYWGYFLGSQAGQSFMQLIPFELFQRETLKELPPVHTKYWGLGIDNDAESILFPLREEYTKTMEQLAALQTSMYECFLNYTTALSSKDVDKVISSKLLFNQLSVQYTTIRNEHKKRINNLLNELVPDDPERLEVYRRKLSIYLAQNYHNELVGLTRFAKTLQLHQLTDDEMNLLREKGCSSEMSQPQQPKLHSNEVKSSPLNEVRTKNHKKSLCESASGFFTKSSVAFLAVSGIAGGLAYLRSTS